MTIQKIELVKSSDMMKFAMALARSIRSRLAWSKQLRNAVTIGTVSNRAGELSVKVKVGEGKTDKSGNPLVGMARAYEAGSGLHGKRRRTYTIAPRLKPNLIFYWGKESRYFIGRDGQSVQHPGVEARPFMKPALQSILSKQKKELSFAIRNNLKRELSIALKGFGK